MIAPWLGVTGRNNRNGVRVVKPFFTPNLVSSSSTSTSSSSISLVSFPSRSVSSISFSRNLKPKGRFGLRVEAYDSSNNDNSNPASAGDSKPPNGTLPEFMELFVKRAPQQVVDAMRQTVTNMIGTLPPQFFAVTITTVAENLAQLMYSIMMTGYMFKNAQYRLELQESLEQVVALPDVQDKKKIYVDCWSSNFLSVLAFPIKIPDRLRGKKIAKYFSLIWCGLVEKEKVVIGQDVPDFASGTQKNVSGEVIRWNNVSGPEKIDAKKYIELLEAEIEELSCQVGRQTSNAQNELLEYLKSLEPRNLKELTSTAGEDVVFAMNAFIKRLLAVSDPSQMKTSVTETSAAELAKLLYWLMVVGYSIRNIEVRYDMERVFGAPPKLAELPPGENV
ncbi:hypothetical protein JHK87_014023 [Glycine soja]|nr:hypothetical protein JHK87_014023 [Glycine soja]